jgi:hypothetical protein
MRRGCEAVKLNQILDPVQGSRTRRALREEFIMLSISVAVGMDCSLLAFYSAMSYNKYFSACHYDLSSQVFN